MTSASEPAKPDLRLIRQSHRGFDLDYYVQPAFENIASPKLAGYGVDRVRVFEGLGCKALRAREPDDQRPAPETAVQLLAECRVPGVV